VQPKKQYKKQEADKKMATKKAESLRKLLNNLRKQAIPNREEVLEDSRSLEPGPSRISISFKGLETTSSRQGPWSDTYSLKPPESSPDSQEPRRVSYLIEPP